MRRSIRLGYSVLMMDSDMLVMDDPYKYFKHPQFKDITVLNQAESPEDPNGGLVYVQNAAPDGPAAFMFAGITAHSFSLPPSLSAAYSEGYGCCREGNCRDHIQVQSLHPSPLPCPIQP